MTCKGWMMCEGIEEHYQRIVLKELGTVGGVGGAGGQAGEQAECGHGDKDMRL